MCLAVVAIRLPDFEQHHSFKPLLHNKNIIIKGYA